MENDIVVFDGQGNSLCLSSADRIGGGGEGDVYAVCPPGGKKKIAVKIFNEEKLEKDGKILSEKIARMVEMGQESDKALVKHPNFAWPQLSACDKNEKFVGYGMRLAEGKPLSRLAHPMLYKEHFPGMDRENVAQMLVRLWASARSLHDFGVYIGDVNLNNVLCTENYEICWIDVDSFQVGEHRCLVGRPEMTPPEHLGKQYADIDRTRESDLFSLAILTFQCLMLGRHPYEHIGASTPEDNLRKGKYPYTEGSAAPGKQGAIPKGPWYIMWSHYTFKIKKEFALAFKGKRDPLRRPSADKWIKVLEEYLGLLRSPTAYGKHSRDMIPSKPKAEGLPHRGTQDKS